MQAVHRQRTHALLVYAHGGQGRVDHLAERGIVKTDDGHILGDAQAALLDGAAAAGGDAVVVGKKGGGQHGVRGQVGTHIGGGRRRGGAYAHHPAGRVLGRSIRQAPAAHQIPVIAAAEVADIHAAVEVAQPGMAAADEVADRVPSAVAVINPYQIIAF